MTPGRLVLILFATSFLPAMASTQQGLPRVRHEIRGFDFRKDGVWRRDARAVRALRRQLLSRRNFGALNAPMATGGGAALAGAAPLRGYPADSAW